MTSEYEEEIKNRLEFLDSLVSLGPVFIEENGGCGE